MQSMKYVWAVTSLLALAGCDGNPFSPEPVDPVDPPPPANNQPVVVPSDLLGNIQNVVYTPAKGSAPASLQIAITGLDTTPVLATWVRNEALDVPGYDAFSVQEDALDRMFIGLAATSADGSVSGAVAGSTHLNTFISGTTYSRKGAFTPPQATGGGPATGQVSYAGDYAGMLNVGDTSGSALLPPPAGTPPELLVGQPLQVKGKAFLNANFADNTVEGTVYDRVVVDGGFGLQSVVLIQTGITANGTFDGKVESPPIVDHAAQSVGIYGGVFGGTGAAGMAGAISLTKVNDVTGEELKDVTERGIFVLNQCGLAGVPSAPGCAGTAP